VSGRVDNRVVPTLGVELLRRARDGDTTGALLLLAIHVEGESEGRLAQSGGLLLQLLDFTLGDSTELENEAPSRSGLAGIDVTADHCSEKTRGGG